MCSSRNAIYEKPEIKQIIPDYPKDQLDITKLPK